MHLLNTLRFLLVFAIFIFSALVGRTKLVWSLETGWRTENGEIPIVNNEKERNALSIINEARINEGGGNTSKAINLYEKAVEESPDSIYAAEALHRAGLLYKSIYQYHKAFDSFEKLLVHFPETENFDSTIREQYQIGSYLLEGKRVYFWGWIPGFHNLERGIEYSIKVIARAPHSKYAPLALMNIVRGQKKLGKPEGAIDALDQIINLYPRSPLVPKAYLEVANIYASMASGAYYDQASTQNAMTFYQDYLALFPNGDGVAAAEKGLFQMIRILAESKLVLGDYYYKHQHNYKAARILYNETITISPDSDIGKKAYDRITNIDAHFNIKNPSAAEKPNKKKRFPFFFF